jgi:hypothetical protein
MLTTAQLKQAQDLLKRVLKFTRENFGTSWVFAETARRAFFEAFQRFQTGVTPTLDVYVFEFVTWKLLRLQNNFDAEARLLKKELEYDRILDPRWITDLTAPGSFWNSLSPEQVARLLGLKRSTVRSRIAEVKRLARFHVRGF